MKKFNRTIATILWALCMFILASKDVDVFVTGNYKVNARKGNFTWSF